MIHISNDQLKHAEKMLKDIPHGLVLAVVPAINRAAKHGETSIAREIRKVYTVKHSTILKQVSLVLATRSHPEAAVIINPRSIALTEFQFSPHRVLGKRPKKGVFVRVKQGGPGGYLPHAFVVQRRGRLDIFERVGEKRFPIKMKFGPATDVMGDNKAVVDRFEKSVGAMMEKRLTHEIDRVLKGVAVDRQMKRGKF